MCVSIGGSAAELWVPSNENYLKARPIN